MIRTLRFPSTCRPARYFNTHPRYIRQTALAAGIEIEPAGDTSVADCRFLAEALTDDGRRWELMFDFDNFPAVHPCQRGHPAVFKFHAEPGHPPNIHPFPVVSFYDWPRYRRLARDIRYTAAGELVLCRQRPHCGAKQRRQHVQGMLKRACGDRARTELLAQEAYWRDVARCLVHVFVPGARNDMLDRGHAQYLALGCCTVAPPIRTLLPWGRRLLPNVHYVQCRADYADLPDVIHWCRGHRDRCRRIGADAKGLFQETSTPGRIWAWVEACLRRV